MAGKRSKKNCFERYCVRESLKWPKYSVTIILTKCAATHLCQNIQTVLVIS